MMVVAAARKTEELVLNNEYKGIVFGIGTSCLAGYLAYYTLKQKGHDIELWLGGSGYHGLSPRPTNSAYPIFADAPSVLTSKMTSDTINAYGIFIGGKQGNCLSILSSAQIDKHGNLNATMLSPESYIIGSGGGNDAANAKEVLLLAPQSRERLVDNVYYVTCPGNRVKTLVTDMGIFQKLDGELTLTSYFPDPALTSPEEAINRIRQNCGWEVKIASHVTAVSPPSLEELLLLRTFDPQGYFTRDR
jgi:acyl CoA:acetate/3-ketoacid CoA transferase beta subunit